MRETVTVMIGGATYSLRPTWEAYAEIEARTGFSIKQLWFRFASGEIRLNEMATILTAGIKASGEVGNISEQKGMQVLFEEGPWWDQDEGVSVKMINYLEALGWTPEQRKKIQAEMDKDKASETISEVSSPLAQQSTD